MKGEIENVALCILCAPSALNVRGHTSSLIAPRFLLNYASQRSSDTLNTPVLLVQTRCLGKRNNETCAGK